MYLNHQRNTVEYTRMKYYLSELQDHWVHTLYVCPHEKQITGIH